MEKKWTEAQWKEPEDEEWEDYYDGLKEWCYGKDEEHHQEKGTLSKETSFILVP